MADPKTNSYNGNTSGNCLVLGSSASDRTTLVQEMASNSKFGRLKGAHWVSVVKLSKARERGRDIFLFRTEGSVLLRTSTILKKLL